MTKLSNTPSNVQLLTPIVGASRTQRPNSLLLSPSLLYITKAPSPKLLPFFSLFIRLGFLSLFSSFIERANFWEREQAIKMVQDPLRNHKKYVSAHLLFRLLAGAATMAAALVMGFNKETKNIAGFQMVSTYKTSPVFE